MKRTLFFSLREIRELRLHKAKLFLLVLFPFLIALLLGGIFSRKVVTQMPLALLDEDQSALSRNLARFISASRSFQISAHPQRISEIEDLMYKERIVAGLYIPKGFERNVKTGHGESLTLYVNGGNLATANLTIADMKLIVGTMAAGVKLKLLRKLGYTKDKAFAIVSPIKVDVTKNFNPGMNYLNYLPPGAWMAALHQLILLFASLLIVGEKEKGKWPELVALSRRRPERLLLGKLLPYFIYFIALLGIFYLFVFPLFSIEFKGSLLTMLTVTAAFVFCTLSLGLLISLNSKRSIDAIKGVLLIGSPAFIISGFSWPRNVLPFFTDLLASFIPLTHFLEAYRKIYQQGASLSYVLSPLFILLAYGLICFFLCFFLLKKREFKV